MYKIENVGMYREMRNWYRNIYFNNNTIDNEGGLHLGEQTEHTLFEVKNV